MPRRLVLVVALTIGCSSFAFAQTVRTWVAGSGSDANPCSRTAPCRNFSAAINAVDPGGEVVVIDSAGYGPVSITKAVSIIAPRGVHAAIAPSTGAAITIADGLTGPVLLRHLFLNSQGGSTGVLHQGGNDLFVEDCEINGFGSGILVTPTAGIYFSVSGCTVRNGDDGIILAGSPGAAVGEIASTVVENNSGAGIYVSGNSRLSVRNAVSANNSQGFVVSGISASMDVNDSAAFKCGTGFLAFGVSGPVRMQLDRCLASENTNGLATGAFGTTGIRMIVSNSMITNNATGVDAAPSGTVIESRGDNTLEGNAAGNTFSDSYTAQ